MERQTACEGRFFLWANKVKGRSDGAAFALTELLSRYSRLFGLLRSRTLLYRARF